MYSPKALYRLRKQHDHVLFVHTTTVLEQSAGLSDSVVRSDQLQRETSGANQWNNFKTDFIRPQKKKKNPQNHDLNSGVVFNEGCLLSVVPVFFQLWWAYVRILVQLTHSVSTPPPPNPLLIGSVNVCLSFLEVFMLRMVFKGDMYLNCLSSMLHTVNMCVDATS